MIELDFILSLGPACRPAEHLRQHDLRHLACPLDWQMGYSLATVLHLYQTSFSDFFIQIEQDKQQPLLKGHRRINDLKNGIISIHHFSADKPIEEEQTHFLKLMHDRYINMHNEILKAERIGLVCNRRDSIEELKHFLLQFGAIYPNHQIVLINIRNQKEVTFQSKQYDINDRLWIIEYEFQDINEDGDDYINNPNAWKGNVSAWNRVMEDIRISTPYLLQKLNMLDYSDKNIIIYGAGIFATKLIQWLQRYHINIFGIAVSNTDNNPPEVQGIPVKGISEYSDIADQCIVIIAVQIERKINEIMELLNTFHFPNIITPYE